MPGAGPREPSAAQSHPAPEVVDAAEVDERAADLRLTEERDAERSAPHDRREGTVRIRVERRDGHGGLGGDAAPDHLQRRVGRSDPRQLLGDSAIADCGTAAEGEREHRRASRDPEPDEQRTTGRRAQAN